LDGRLAKATRISGIKDFSTKDFGLLEIKAVEWGPLVFVLLGQEPARGQGVPPEGLGELRALLDRQGFSAGLTHLKRRSYTVGCNWKVVVDNYDDGGYHVPYAHKGLDGNLDLQSYRTSVHHGYSLQTCRGAAGEGASERLGAEAVYAHVYPNLMINRYGPWCDVNMVSRGAAPAVMTCA
jgi:choline monooxygenase